MKTLIKLNNEISFDLEKLVDSKLLIQANSGGGKSWAIRRILEQSHGKVQQIIIDPEGEFSTLREKFDYILFGKGGDFPAESKTAGLLALKILEHNFSAIIDLYELSPQERKHFVRLFLESMVNSPKELHHDVIVVIDEAHMFVPEKGDSEAANAVIDLASRGRKRGFCSILATQRISKLHKDAAAECNNKLIGRTGLDIDRKRASEELGFTQKEQSLSLRSLEPGEFFAFGPAISNDVITVKIGSIETSHPRAGSRSLSKIAPPTANLRKILAKLTDLPQEAAKEARTMEELRAEVRTLKQANRGQKEGVSSDFQQKIVEKAVKAAVLENSRKNEKILSAWIKYAKDILWMVDHLHKSAHQAKVPEFIEIKADTFKDMKFEVKIDPIEQRFVPKIPSVSDLQADTLGRCSRMIYSYLVHAGGEKKTKTQVAVAVGYSQNSGGFNNSISELSAAGFIQRENGSLYLLDSTRKDLITTIDPSLEKWSSKLGACSRAIWQLLIGHPHNEETWTKDQIAEATEYSVSSGGFNNSLSELSALGLIERLSGGMIRINPEVLNL